MRYRTKSSRKHNYYATRTPYSGGGGYTSSQSTTEYQPGQTVNIPTPNLNPPKGKPGLVLILSTALLLFATWDGFGKEAMSTLMSGTDFNPSIPFPMIVGGIVFIAILYAISEAEGGDVALYMVIGLWLLFIMFNGQKQWASFWDWFSGNVYGGGAFGTFGDVFKKSTPLPDTSGASSSNPSSNITIIGNYNTGSSQGNSGTQNATPQHGLYNF
jgi:hypothetical protein